MDDFSMDKIMSLAGLLGQNADINDIMNAVNAAQKISSMMNFSADGQQETPDAPDEIKPFAVPAQRREHIPPTNTSDARSRQIKAINAVLPFLAPEYQRSIFTALKLIEINSFYPKSPLTIMEKGSENERRLKMINTVESYLTSEEKLKMKTVLNTIKAGSVII